MPTIEAYYGKKMTCPFCQTGFSTYRVRSRAAVPAVIDSDFCAHYRDKNVNPIYYTVSVCPECGYAFTEEFSSDFPAGTRDAIQKLVTEKWEKRSYDGVRDPVRAIAAYKLAILSATLKREKHIVMGNLCLRLAWVYRIEEEAEQEERFLRLALDEYEKSYLASDFTSTSITEIRLLFLLGEISRRVKDYQKAISYFSKIVEHRNKNVELKIVNRAREQWTATIEEYRKLNDGEEKTEKD